MKLVSKGLFKSIKEFKMLNRKLGNGSFGVVNLALHKATGRLYAIKQIDLATVPSEVEMKLVERQIKLHSSVHHPHIVTLWDTISDEGSMYIILQYAEQGNLFYYQNSKQVFSEPEAAIFFSQTARAVEYLHSLNIMHRDLKPENLLLDRHLNIKLCDFGWSAQNIHTPRTTFCGTYEYMAPQMLFGTAYDYNIDLWALGVLLYQLLHGHAPFRGESVNQVKQHMLQGSYQLSDSLSDSLKQLITGILKFDPKERLPLKDMLTSEWVKAMQEIIAKCSEEVSMEPPNHLHLLLSKVAQEKSMSKTTTTFKKEKAQTKNISFNLSINNFSLIKNGRGQFVSPAQAYLDKKKKKDKEQKRVRTHAEQQLLELAHSLSPFKKEKTQKRGRVSRKARLPGRRSQDVTQRSPFGRNDSSLFSKNPSKQGSVLKKKSIHEKVVSNVTSMKSIHRVKTGQRGLMATLTTS